MLRELHIKDFILIKNLSLNFNPGFSVFTGETGAGKSILLDGLALVLGQRANYSNIRKNEPFSEVSAVFDCKNNPQIIKILKDNFISLQDNLIIRRIITSESKSRSFINDTPVSVSFLKIIGDLLIDIHGQFDNHKLLNSSFHCEILDNFLPETTYIEEVKTAYLEYKNFSDLYNKMLNESNSLNEEKEYIEFSLQELEELNLKEGEEKYLSDQKISLNNAKRIQTTLDKIEDNLVNNNVLSSFNKLLKVLEASRDILENHNTLNEIILKIENAYSTVTDAVEYYNELSSHFYSDNLNVEQIDERLMNIRTIAHKHRVLPDDLLILKNNLADKLQTIKNSSSNLDDLKKQMLKAEKYFYDASYELSKIRKQTAQLLEDKVKKELQYLKLPNAEFLIDIDTNVKNMSVLGIDKIIFKVKTNIGSDFGFLNKVASGGEMARIMLAIKIVLAEVGIITTIILDEIDIGVGGDVADSIGCRLQYLAKNVQTMVITHSHQVASRGKYHFKVSKKNVGNFSETTVNLLSKEDRVSEIARMLSGAQITEETKKAAIALLAASND